MRREVVVANEIDSDVRHRNRVPKGRLDVLIVDDHSVFAEALCLAIENSESLHCMGIASTAADALSAADRAQPDAVVLDLDLASDDGLALTRDLTSRHPDLLVLVLTGQTPNAQLVQASADAGAAGFVPKLASLDALVEAVSTLTPECFTIDRPTLAVLCGHGRFAQTTPSRHDNPTGELTGRERDILELLASGVDLQNASAHLGISVNTSRGYVKNLYRKLGVHNQLELLAVARKTGLIDEAAP